jgi:hypothetical protein
MDPRLSTAALAAVPNADLSLLQTRLYEQLGQPISPRVQHYVATLTGVGGSLQLGPSGVSMQFRNPMLSSQPLPIGQGLVLAPIVPPYAPILMPQAAAGTYLPFSSNAIAPFKTRCLRSPSDDESLIKFQVYLRMNIEVFAASTEDIESSIRGRNKEIRLHQIGLRCRHCAHVSPEVRTKGSTYFPVSTLGFYQAAQNRSSSHLQCGLCSEMPDSIKHVFAKLLGTKTPGSSSKNGRKSQQALQMGLVNTEHGVFAVDWVPPGTRRSEDASA